MEQWKNMETSTKVGLCAITSFVLVVLLCLLTISPRSYDPLEYRYAPLKGADEITISRGEAKLVLNRNTNELFLFASGKLVATSDTGGVTNESYGKILTLTGWGDSEQLAMLNLPEGVQWTYLGLAQEMVKELDIECEYTRGGFTHKLPVHGFREVQDEPLEINEGEVLQL